MRLMHIVNQIQLYGEDLLNEKMVEKVMISVPQRFKAKILTIEESCDMSRLTIVDLVSKIEEQEQRVSMRANMASEDDFLAAHNGVKFNNLGKKLEGSRIRARLNFSVPFVISLATPKIFAGPRRNKQRSNLNNKQMPVRRTKSKANTLYFNSLDRSFKTNVKLGNGDTIQVQGKGSICVNTLQANDEVSNLWHKRVETCQLGKSHGLPFSHDGVMRANLKLELVHSDLCGPMKTPLLNGSKLKVLRIDNGGEYVSKEFNDFCKEVGIHHHLIVPHTPKQNGEKNDVQKHNIKPLTEEDVIVDDVESNEIENDFATTNTTDVEAEVVTIEKNDTWFLIDRPIDKNIMGVKWVYRIKFNYDGIIFRHKARLVVKGYAKIGGVDYGDMFAPVSRLNTIKLHIVIAGQMGWSVFHLYEYQVYKLKKALYGLKQAPRAWYYRIDSYLQKYGFQRRINEANLYLTKIENADLLIVCLYVDDLLVMGSNVEVISIFKSTTRPDLMFPAMLLSRFPSSPTDVHLDVSKRVLRSLAPFIFLSSHQCLTELAKRRGSEMHLQLGELSHIVVSSPEAAREVMKTHDINFAIRPYLLAVEILSTAIGGRCKLHETFLPILRELVELGAGFTITDMFHSFKLLPVISEMRAKLKRFYHDLDVMLERIIEEHKSRNANPKNSDDVTDDLVDVLLHLQDHGDLEISLTTDHIKAVILDMIGAGTETSSTTSEWAMSEMMKNPRVLEKAQAEAM
ncbi:putative Cytochrome P450 71D10 [Hibiscus syriacus]|uniref:Cytochrome P450 71D10 n=1 Tax=Hibiscus syriacus TaxID=106335 RepID=A0A6A3AM66_HIBSY|nr:putative Cytochrome P450 71D10 [Hibiscus syriacus]